MVEFDRITSQEAGVSLALERAVGCGRLVYRRAAKMIFDKAKKNMKILKIFHIRNV
jgi:hypothetical protein